MEMSVGGGGSYSQEEMYYVGGSVSVCMCTQTNRETELLCKHLVGVKIYFLKKRKENRRLRAEIKASVN